MKKINELLERINDDPDFRALAKEDVEKAAGKMGFSPEELSSYTIKSVSRGGKDSKACSSNTGGENCGTTCGSEMGCGSKHGSGLSDSCKPIKPGVVECPSSCGVSGTAGIE